MILSVEFNSLDIFCAEYDASIQSGNNIKVHVRDGLGVKDDLKPFFYRRYLHDQWRNIKYDKWEISNGVLRARIDRSGKGHDDWVEIGRAQMANELLGYEYVGDCWFVFEGVTYARRTIAEYTPDRKGFTGIEIVDEVGSQAADRHARDEYSLEGVFTAPPGPGWMSWKIRADSFFIEISNHAESPGA